MDETSNKVPSFSTGTIKREDHSYQSKQTLSKPVLDCVQCTCYKLQSRINAARSGNFFNESK